MRRLPESPEEGGRALRELRVEASPGREAIVLSAVALGIILLGMQLWLLTIALERYLAGHGSAVWILAAISGAIFAGGLAALWLLGRHPQIRR